MKYFIVSDIHGSASDCEKALSQYGRLGCDMIICLGDILYHGPRNPIPEGYDSNALCALLNPLADRIVACRGNCDCEVCEMVLDFPLMSDYNIIVDGTTKIFATHGHRYSPTLPDGSQTVKGSVPPPKFGYDIFLYGHTHLPVLQRDALGRIICNPGSTTLPKGGNPKSFAVYEDGHITIYGLDGEEIMSV
ncbi:MAG: phosphodiesterase [Bacteroidales bacterium]|nr:phosphodiesterase [Bacteroidales bacterium]